MIRAICFALLMLPSSALAEDVDRGSSGAIVTIRPSETEQAAIIDEAFTPLQLPDDTPAPMWLVNPQAWRKATAEVERLSVYPEIVTDHESTIVRLTSDVETLQIQLSTEQQARVQAETQAKMYKKQRSKWALAGAGAGAAVVAGGILVAAFAL